MSGASDIVGNSDEGAVANRDGVLPLHHVDNLVTHAESSIGDARVTAIAQQLLNYDPEAMVWQDSPALALMLSSVLKWLILVLIWLAVLAVLSPSASAPKADIVQPAQVEKTESDKHSRGKKTVRAGSKGANSASEANVASNEGASNGRTAAQATSAGKSDDTWYYVVKWIGILIIVCQLYKHLAWALRLKSIRYKMSSQRLIIESGIFSKVTNTYELHKLGAGQIQSPLLPRMFGCSNLYVGVWLSGIRNAEAVRDLIRNAGQIEASRIEKARWR
ncbi:Bacterial membrane flanked domain protein [Caballeronia ptereochthonis]|uniref:Bacterial membrane flanked domain protein n=2 Tax=Caballeronia ptereochthonis TaxID=1777144 RepID=A0A158A507_9BURK|nr:Bacterial membrane flanked domain protein [Caballeronia ptereochthonis]